MRQYFDGADPVGKRIYTDAERKSAYEIVGVVNDAKYAGIRQASPPMVYKLLSIDSGSAIRPKGPDKGSLKFVNELEVRAVGNTATLPASLRAAIHSVDPNLKVEDISRLGELVDATLVRERAIAKLSSFFGLLALLLASIGLYGIMSYSVSQRTTEIGIRLALGAEPGSVQRLILRDTLLLLAIGISVGVPASVAASK
jgi:ABC-type antimicrobial peptide transport system permease subunit